MVDKVVSVLVMALAITGLGIALRPGAPTARVLAAGTTGFARIQTAAYGQYHGSGT